MNRFFSIGLRVTLVGAAVVLLLLALLLGVIWYYSRPPSDRDLVNSYFDSQLPGYSHIEILERTGAHSLSDPRRVVFTVDIESYPEAVTCQGEIQNVLAGPSLSEVNWSSWECAGHYLLVEHTRGALQSGTGPPPCGDRIEDMALVLYRWIDNGWTDVHQIVEPHVERRVKRLFNGEVSLSENLITLTSASELEVHDLAPEVPEHEKVPTYVLRCDGTLELYLRAGPRWWETPPIELQPYDALLPTPVGKPID
jgi:Na+-transporting methylmalonyl-CoA/oxaloacetate decarboxylase gamma subunit